MAHTTVSIGLLLPMREVVMAQGAPDLSKIIDLAVRAEELGFDSVWAGIYRLRFSCASRAYAPALPRAV